MEPDTYITNRTGRIQQLDITTALQEVRRIREGDEDRRNKGVIELLLSRLATTRNPRMVGDKVSQS